MTKRLFLAALLGLMLTASTAHSETAIVTQASGEEVRFGVTYTANSVTEFLWGLTRPIHLWNTLPNGRVEVLPFWTHPLKAGGFLCWINPRAWQLNPSLTAGTLVSEIAIAAAASSSSGGSSSSAPVSNTSNPDDDTEPCG